MSSTVIWSASMEAGDLAEWYSPSTGPTGNYGGATENSGAADASASADVAHSGHYSAKLTITTPNNPVSGARIFRWLEPQTHPDLYYRAWYYFPEVTTPNGTPAWWNVFEWKSHGISEGDNPAYTLNVGETVISGQATMYFYLCPPNSSTGCYSQTAPFTFIPLQRWTEVEAHYVCAPDNTGHVTIWQDGKQLFDLSGPTRYADGDCEWAVANYSAGLNPSPTSIYVDDAAICLNGRCP